MIFFVLYIISIGIGIHAADALGVSDDWAHLATNIIADTVLLFIFGVLIQMYRQSAKAGFL